MPLRKVVLDKFSWQSSENEHSPWRLNYLQQQNTREAKKKALFNSTSESFFW
jgi:hypothetical protein